MKIETPGTETLVCPSCGAELIVSWAEPQQRKRRTVQSLDMSHPIPACTMFSAAVDPESYLADARAGVTYKANDG